MEIVILRGDINTCVYNNHLVIQYDKYNKIGQYGLFSAIKYNKDKNKNKDKNSGISQKQLEVLFKQEIFLRYRQWLDIH